MHKTFADKIKFVAMQNSKFKPDDVSDAKYKKN